MDIIQEEDQETADTLLLDDRNSAAYDGAANLQSDAQPNEEPGEDAESAERGDHPGTYSPKYSICHPTDPAGGQSSTTAVDEVTPAAVNGDPDQSDREPSVDASPHSDVRTGRDNTELQAVPRLVTAGNVVTAEAVPSMAQGIPRVHSGDGAAETVGTSHYSTSDPADRTYILFETAAGPQSDASSDGDDHEADFLARQPTRQQSSESVPSPATLADGLVEPHSEAPNDSAGVQDADSKMQAGHIQPDSGDLAGFQKPTLHLHQPAQPSPAADQAVYGVDSIVQHGSAVPPPPQEQQHGMQLAPGRRHSVQRAAALPAPEDIGDSKAIAAAQATLRQQLLSTAAWMEGQLAQLSKAAQVAAAERQLAGVQLYEVQEQLHAKQAEQQAKQAALEAAAATRAEAEQRLAANEKAHAESQAAAQAAKDKVAELKQELLGQRTNLLRARDYNEAISSELAVTQRQTYATEEAVQRLEAEQAKGDELILRLEDQLRSADAELARVRASAARCQQRVAEHSEVIAQTDAAADGVRAETKALVAQWQDSLSQLRAADAAMQAAEGRLAKRHDELRTVHAECAGIRRDAAAAAAAAEQTQATKQLLVDTAVMLEARTEAAQAATAAALEQAAAQQTDVRRLEAELAAAHAAGKRLAAEQAEVEAAQAATDQDIKAAQAQVLQRVLGQAQARRAAARSVAHIAAQQARTAAAEAALEGVRDRFARIAQETAESEVQMLRLAEERAALDRQLAAAEGEVVRLGEDEQRCHAAVERALRQVDVLNRRYEKLTADLGKGEDTGPLEALIRETQAQLAGVRADSGRLQRVWAARQTALAALQAENAALEEAAALKQRHIAVLTVKRTRLERELTAEELEAKRLDREMATHRQDLAQADAGFAAAATEAGQLEGEHAALQATIVNELKELEAQAQRLQTDIAAGQAAAGQASAVAAAAAAAVKQLEADIQADLRTKAEVNPHAVEEATRPLQQALRDAQLRQREVARDTATAQAALQAALGRREALEIKERAAAEAVAPSGSSPVKQLRAAELHRGLRNATKETLAAKAGLAALQQQQQDAAAAAAEAEGRCAAARAATEEAEAATQQLQAGRVQALQVTALLQRRAKRYDCAAAGKLRLHTTEPAAAQQAEARHAAAVAAAEAAGRQYPQAGAALQLIVKGVQPLVS